MDRLLKNILPRDIIKYIVSKFNKWCCSTKYIPLNFFNKVDIWNIHRHTNKLYLSLLPNTLIMIDINDLKIKKAYDQNIQVIQTFNNRILYSKNNGNEKELIMTDDVYLNDGNKLLVLDYSSIIKLILFNESYMYFYCGNSITIYPLIEKSILINQIESNSNCRKLEYTYNKISRLNWYFNIFVSKQYIYVTCMQLGKFNILVRVYSQITLSKINEYSIKYVNLCINDDVLYGNRKKIDRDNKIYIHNALTFEHLQTIKTSNLINRIFYSNNCLFCWNVEKQLIDMYLLK